MLMSWAKSHTLPSCTTTLTEEERSPCALVLAVWALPSSSQVHIRPNILELKSHGCPNKAKQAYFTLIPHLPFIHGWNDI